MPLACCIGDGSAELTDIFGFAPKVDAAQCRDRRPAGYRPDAKCRTCEAPALHPFTMREIDERGLRAVMTDAIEIATDGTAGFHLSFDMDAVDPR